MEYLSWNGLTAKGPWFAYFVALIADFGLMSVMRLVQVFILHGGDFGTDRGHWSFWMVVGYDLMVLPVAAALIVRFAQAHPEPAQVWQEIGATVCGLGIAAFFILRADPNYKDWSKPHGFNAAGLWHIFVLAAFAQFFVQHWARGVMHFWNHGMAGWPLFVISIVLVLVLVPIIFLGVDEKKLVDWMRPGDIIAALTGWGWPAKW